MGKGWHFLPQQRQEGVCSWPSPLLLPPKDPTAAPGAPGGVWPLDTDGEVRAGEGDPGLGPHSMPTPTLLSASPQACGPEQNPGGVVGGPSSGWGHAEGISAVSIPAAPSQGSPCPGVMLEGGDLVRRSGCIDAAAASGIAFCLCNTEK